MEASRRAACGGMRRQQVARSAGELGPREGPVAGGSGAPGGPVPSVAAWRRSEAGMAAWHLPLWLVVVKVVKSCEKL